MCSRIIIIIIFIQKPKEPELTHDEKERSMLKKLLHERRDEAIEAKRQRPVELKRMEHAEKRDQLIAKLAHAIREHKKKDQEAVKQDVVWRYLPCSYIFPLDV